MEPISTIPLKGLFLCKANIATGGTKGQSPDPIYMRCRTDDRINFKCSMTGAPVPTHFNLPNKPKEVLEWAPIVTDAFYNPPLWDDSDDL